MKATRSASVAKLVVVIDDDPLILEATEGLLRSWGCCVVAARSCDEALVRLAETEAGRRPDVIVCDYQLSRGIAVSNQKTWAGRAPLRPVSDVRSARAGCRAVRDSTLVAWYRFLYAPRTGGAYDSHHRTA